MHKYKVAQGKPNDYASYVATMEIYPICNSNSIIPRDFWLHLIEEGYENYFYHVRVVYIFLGQTVSIGNYEGVVFSRDKIFHLGYSTHSWVMANL